MALLLRNQVCTLEQAKRLKELGVQQDSMLYHIWNTVPLIGYEGIKIRADLYQKKNTGAPVDSGVIRYYSAFTVAELGEMLPTLGIKRCKSNNGMGKDYYWLEYKSQDWSDLNEAQLLAKFLIYLLEEDIIKPESLNN